jgi:ribosomal protein S18 acetylase RimI-like enzyme
MSRLDTVQWGGDRLRVGPWRGDHRIAYVAPAPSQPPTADALEQCLHTLTDRGYRSVLTSALSPIEQQPFLALAFTVHEHLHLLRHELDREFPRPDRSAAPVTRRGRRRDRTAVLRVDHLAFNPFWRFDESGLDDARRATPISRFRVVVSDHAVVGYAVTGRAGPVSYLQRLAVDPAHQRRGVARALVADALRWARRRGALSMLVNTQQENDGALALYRSLGFVLELQGLDVLERELTGGSPTGPGVDPGTAPEISPGPPT